MAMTICKKPSVLLAGKGISCDKELKIRLTENCKVIAVSELQLAEKVPEWEDVDLAVLELSSGDETELETLKFFKKNQPLVFTVVVDGDGATEAAVKAFELGAKDFFHKPYKTWLLGDRIEGLLKRRLLTTDERQGDAKLQRD